MTKEELDDIIQQIHNNKLTSLELIGEKISDDQTIAIARVLQSNTSLTEIRLASNQMGHEGVIAIAAALEENSTLTTLCIDSDHIGDEGLKAFAKTLQHNTTLTMLQLMDWGAQISDESARAIAEVLESNTTLTSLYIDYGDMNAEIEERIVASLERNKEMQEKKQAQTALYTQQSTLFDWIGNPPGEQPVPEETLKPTRHFLLEGNNATFFKLSPNPDPLFQLLPLDVLQTQFKLQQNIHLEVVKPGK